MIPYLVLGYIVIWGVRNSENSLLRRLWKIFYQCDFCLGVWVYFLLAAWLKPPLLSPLPYTPILTEFATALLTSWVMHWISVGLESQMVTYRE